MAVVFEQRSVADVVADYQVSRSWIYELVARYHREGESAFTPRSKRPHTSPTRINNDIVELIIATRQQLVTQGLDAGMATIRWHLKHHFDVVVSESTIHRKLVTAGLVTPAPKKRPKNSYTRFQAELPNECWQADMTHYRLATGDDAEVLTWLDDHSRYALSVTAHTRVTGPIVIDTFTKTADQHGYPASTLTDNAMYFTTRFARGGNSGPNQFETLLTDLGINQKNSRPNHPTTCGKVERFQQTLKRWLEPQPQPTTITELQTLLNTFAHTYNNHRPHRSLPHRTPPTIAYTTRPKATPTNTHTHHPRIRHDRIDNSGKVTLRHNSHLYKIGIGRTHAKTPIIMLIHHLNIRIIHANTGELLRHLTLDTTRTYQPTHKPRNPPQKPKKPNP